MGDVERERAGDVERERDVERGRCGERAKEIERKGPGIADGSREELRIKWA